MPHNNIGEIFRTSSGGDIRSIDDIYHEGDIGVSISDVSAVLDSQSDDLGVLCKDSNINKWSKRKPVSFANEVFKLTDGQLQEINYGLSVPTQITHLDLQTLYNNLNGEDGESNLDAAYLYTKPSGGTLASPYRLLDFEGYSHAAKAPISISANITDNNGNFKVKIKKTTNQNQSYQFQFIMNIFGSKSVIGLMDLSSTFENYYLCLGVYKNNDGWYVKTASSPITSSNGKYITFNSIDLDSVISQNIERKCVIGLCNQQWSDNLVKTPVNSSIFYYPPMGSAASCIGTILYAATVGPSVSLYPNVSTMIDRDGTVKFGFAVMQIQLGRDNAERVSGPVEYELTLESSDPEKILEGKIANCNPIWSRDKKSCTIKGTITGSYELNDAGYVNVGSLFKTLTRDVITTGTVKWDSQTYNVHNDGQFVVNEQE